MVEAQLDRYENLRMKPVTQLWRDRFQALRPVGGYFEAAHRRRVEAGGAGEAPEGVQGT